ncbi:MAG: hypothetical protein WAM04_18905 [Candidatus Sulfotelmatobacter sp.]
MKLSSRSRERPSELSPIVHHRLTTYALAAGATGVSLLALAPPSQAEIVYTPVNAVIGRGSTYRLDVNGDGIVDFTIAERPGINQDRTSQILWAKGATGNAVVCSTSNCASIYYAVALRPGSQIGNVRGQGWLGRNAPMAFEELPKLGTLTYGGPWVNVTNRYLGLKFKISGELHYGWARLTVKFHGGPPKDRTWEAYLTGYAYETVAGKSIVAGQTKGSTDGDESDASLRRMPDAIHIATLGKLALGSDGIALWRREDIVSASIACSGGAA